MLSSFLTHLNPSSRKNLLLAISDLTRLKIQLRELSIDYMSMIQGISQHMQGNTMERIIPIFAIASTDNDRYPGVKSCYLVGDAALVNCDLLKIRGLLSIKDTRQHTLVIPRAPPSNTVASRVSKIPTKPPPEGFPAPHPLQPPTQSCAVAYPQPMGFPWNCIAAMMRKDKSCPGCHFNHPEDSPQLKFHKEVGYLALV